MNATPELLELDDDTLDDTLLAAEGPVLVDFWAPWCGPCKLQGVVMAELARECSDWLTVAKVDVEASPTVAAAYGVKSLPTLMLFEHGTVSWRVSGARPKARLLTEVTDALVQSSKTS